MVSIENNYNEHFKKYKSNASFRVDVQINLSFFVDSCQDLLALQSFSVIYESHCFFWDSLVRGYLVNILIHSHSFVKRKCYDFTCEKFYRNSLGH